MIDGCHLLHFENWNGVLRFLHTVRRCQCHSSCSTIQHLKPSRAPIYLWLQITVTIVPLNPDSMHA